MTGATKVAGNHVPNMNHPDQIAEKHRRHIEHKHLHHHNHLGAHQHESEKERLKKHFLELERMFQEQQDDETVFKAW